MGYRLLRIPDHDLVGPTLPQALQNLHERSLRFWFISLTAHEHHREVQKEHRAIFEAIRNHDPDAATQAMIDHIDSFRRNVTRYLERGTP